MADQTSRLVIEIDTRNTIRTINDLSNQLNNMERNGDAAGRSMNSLSSATSKLAGYMAGLVTVGSAIAKMDMYTGLNNRLKLVTNSQNELNTAMADTFAIAQKTGQAWQVVTETYQRFADNAKRLNLTQEKTAQLTDTVSKAISISGGSAESAQAALVQFSQALSANVLRGEELNSVMEQAPGLAKAIAQGMGITVGELRGVAAQGKITGDVLVEALTKAKGSVDDLFGKTDFTIGQSFTLLSNAVTKFVGEAGKGSGAASTLSSAIRSLGENLSTIADIAVVGGVTALTKVILSQAVAMQASIAASTERRAALLAELQGTATATASEVSRTAAIAELRAMQLADAQATAARMSGMARLTYVQTTVLAAERASTAATAAHTAAVEVDTAAQTANNNARSLGASAFALMGGWVGAATLAVGALAAGYMLLKDNADQATTSLDIQKQTVIDLTNEYSKMSAAKLVSEMDAVDKKIKDAQSSAESAKRSLTSLVVPQSADFITDDEIKRQSLMSDQLKKIETQGLSTAQALKALQASKLFTNDELKDAQKYFAALDDGTNSARELGYQKELANSYMQKASGLYSDNADKISKLTNESDRLSASYSTSRENATKAAEAILQIGQNSGASATQLDKAQAALKSFSNGTMTATDLAKVLQANLPIPDSTINSFIEQAKESDNFKSLMSKVNAELKTQNQLRSDFLSQHKSVLGAEQELTTEKQKQLQAEQQLNALKKTSIQKQQETQYQLNNLKTSGENENTKAWNTFITKWRNDNKLTDFTKPLTEGQYALAAKEFLLEQKLSGINSKIKEDKREQTKELKKQQEILQVNAKVQAAAAKYNFSGIEAKNGLPQGLLSAIMMNESRGNANAYNKSTGAAGAFQFIPTTAKQYKVDTSSVQSSAEGAGKYLAYLLDKFNGNLKKAIQAYHAGEGNVQKGTKLGPINRKYVSDAFGYLAGSNGAQGSTTTDFQSYLEDQTKLYIKSKDEADKIIADLADQNAKIDLDLKEKLKAITENTALSEPQKKTLSDSLKERMAAQKELNDKVADYEINGFKYTEEQKLIYNRDTQKLMLVAEGKYNAEQIKKAKSAIDEQYNYQIKAAKLARDDIILNAEQALLTEIEYNKRKYKSDIDNINQTYKEDKALAEQLAAFKGQLYAKSLKEQYDNAKKTWDQLKVDLGLKVDPTSNPFAKLQTTYKSNDKTITDTLNTKNSLTDSAEAEAKRLLREQNIQDEQDYQYQLTQIEQAAEAERTQNASDAAKMRQANDKLYKDQSIQLTLSTYENMFGSMAGLLGNMVGEQSSAYQAMFAIQKAFAVAQAVMNIPSAYSKAYDAVVGTPYVGPYIAPVVGATAAALQVVQAAQIKSTNMSGFATGGLITGAGTGTSDSIPILASNKEYMIKASSVQSLGVGTLDYLNKYGQLPTDTKRVGSDTMTALAQGQQTQANVQAQANSANGVGNTEVKLNNINVLDPSLMGDYMSSTSGTKTMTNFIKSNRSAIKAIIG